MIVIQWVGLIRAMRPGKDAPSRWIGAGDLRSGGNRTPTERGVCFPHGMKHDRQLSGEADPSLFEANSF